MSPAFLQASNGSVNSRSVNPRSVNPRVVHEAERELLYSTLSVRQIAGLPGFDDEARFGRIFRKQTGRRPNAFRDIARRRLAP